jgi:hypothetical protein
VECVRENGIYQRVVIFATTLLLSSMSAGIAMAQTAAPAVSYAFSEASGSNIVDLSGNGNTGTLSSATHGAGRFGAGVTFPGVVQLPPTATLTLTTLTFESWVYPTSRGNWQGI